MYVDADQNTMIPLDKVTDLRILTLDVFRIAARDLLPVSSDSRTMTCHMAKKPIPLPTPTVRISLLEPSGASLTFKLVNRGAALDMSSQVTDVKPTPRRVLPFHCKKRDKIPKSGAK